MTGLSGSVHDCEGFDLLDDCQNGFAIANVNFVMSIALNQAFQSLLIPTRVTLRAEKDGSLVIVQSMDFPTELEEVQTDFGSDEAGRAGD